MKFVVAVCCLLLGLMALAMAIDASGRLQDAPPSPEQTWWTLPYAAMFVVFSGISLSLFIKAARRGM